MVVRHPQKPQLTSVPSEHPVESLMTMYLCVDQAGNSEYYGRELPTTINIEETKGDGEDN